MAETGEDIVRFTAKELLARMDAKLDSLTSSIIALDKTVQSVHEFRVNQERINEDKENRIRNLEKKVWILSATAAVGGSGIATALQQVLGGS